MSPRLPVISGADAVQALKQARFEVISQRGSHVKMRHSDGRIAIVPMHRELAPGTEVDPIFQTTGLVTKSSSAPTGSKGADHHEEDDEATVRQRVQGEGGVGRAA